MADFQAEVPEKIENVLNKTFRSCVALIGQEKQKIDIRARRQPSAPIAANGQNRNGFRIGRVGQAQHILCHKCAQRAHDIILQIGQIFRAARAL